MGVVTLSTLTLAFMSVGSPATNRLRAYDQRRIENLSNIASCLEGYWLENGKVLTTLKEVMNSRNCGYLDEAAFGDPETQMPYDYAVIDADTYSLCATFSLPDEQGGAQYFVDRSWRHEAGRVCFERDLPPLKQGELMAPKPLPAR